MSAVGLAVLSASGCGGDTSSARGPLEGDCVARIGYAGAVYRPNSDLRRFAPAGRRLGNGTELDCDGGALDRHVPVRAIRGIAPGRAVIVTGHGGMSGIYLEEQLRRSEWPAALRRP